MVEIKLPIYKNQKFLSLIPQQREQISAMLADQRISTFSLNSDRTKAWVIINAASETDVLKLMESFHLYRYMRVNIELLITHDNNAYRLPPIMMN